MLAAMRPHGTAGGSLQAARLQVQAPQLAALDVPPQARGLNDPQAAARVWVQGLGSHGQLDGQQGVHSVDQDTAGGLLGADWSLGPQWRLGALAGYGQTDLDAGSGVSGDIDSSHLGLYGLRQDGPLALRLGAAYSFLDGDNRREVSLSGSQQDLHSSYDADTQQAFAELGYQLDQGRLLLEPFFNLGYQRYSRDSYSEHGGSAALQVDAQTQDNFTNTLGLNLAFLRVLDSGMSMTPRLGIGWEHTWGTIDSSAQQAFLAGGSAFEVEGVALDRNTLQLELGVDFGVSPTQSFGFGFTGQKGDNTQQYALVGQWQMGF
jgi:outer membrane autotransporter protein